MDTRTSPAIAAQASGAPELTVVIPTFNERDNIGPLVQRLRVALAGERWEAIFVDDNSPDGTAEAVRALASDDPRIRCIRRVHRRGLAGACLEGILASQAPFAAVMDADLQHDETALMPMLNAVRSGADLAVASRYAEGGSTGDFSSTRLAASRFATWLAKHLIGIKLSDPMSGFFLVRREAVETMAERLPTQGYKILMEIAANGGDTLKVVEVPYRFAHRQAGQSKLDARVVLDFATLLVARLTHGVLPPQFLMFCLVGASGVVVHMAALAAFETLLVSFVPAQITAALLAIASNFLLNNVITYRDRTLHGWAALRGFILFALICAFGLLSNISVANWLLTADRQWWLAGLTGAVISAVWNYAVSVALVWRE
jgi:dolichol-phosphate mannosyltransferase